MTRVRIFMFLPKITQINRIRNIFLTIESEKNRNRRKLLTYVNFLYFLKF